MARKICGTSRNNPAWASDAAYCFLCLIELIHCSFLPPSPRAQSEPIRVVVTGAAGQIAYSLLYMIAKGDVFGPNQRLILHLLDIPPMMGVLEGVVMELADCALPLLAGVVPTTDPAVAFKDVVSAFLVGAMPRKQGMERKDLLSANVKIFKVQGEALNNYARKVSITLIAIHRFNSIDILLIFVIDRKLEQFFTRPNLGLVVQ